MTVVPVKIREPLRRSKRLIGIAVVTIGMFVLIATLIWLVVYFAEGDFDLIALRALFDSELGYWLPVLIFNVPGLLLVFHGQRMMRNVPISLLESVEVLALGVTIIVAACFALSLNA